MSQSLARVWLHIVFSTKNREPLLRDPALREEMFAMLGYQANENECPVGLVGGWIDHVHILCGLSRTLTMAKLIENIGCSLAGARESGGKQSLQATV